MDATVTIKFFRIMPPAADAPKVHEFLKAMGDRELVDREIDLGEDVVMRLERLEQRPNMLVGEFCRIQDTNIPPTASDEGLAPTVLENGKGLGHLGAFIYHTPTRLLLLQVNQLCSTPNRVSLYLSAAANKALYILERVPSAGVLKRMKHREIKAFEVKFAEPENLEALDDAALSALKGVKRAARALGAHEIEIRIAAGKRQKKKPKPHLVQDAVRAILTKLSGAGDNVETLRADPERS